MTHSPHYGQCPQCSAREYFSVRIRRAGSYRPRTTYSSVHTACGWEGPAAYTVDEANRLVDLEIEKAHAAQANEVPS